MINHRSFHSGPLRRHRRCRRRCRDVDLLLELKRISTGFAAARRQHVEALYNDTSRSGGMRRVAHRHAGPCIYWHARRKTCAVEIFLSLGVEYI